VPDDPLPYPEVEDPAPFSSETGILVVVRHGSTSWSDSGRHTGCTDVPLEKEGRLEAQRLRDRLAGHRFARVLTSPLVRARETCSLAGFGAEAEVCEDLAEWDYGAYEGLTTTEIRERQPGWVLWRDGVPGGETLEDVARRADEVVAVARSTGGDVLAFAHGHLLRVLCARWVDLAPEEAARFLLSPAAIGVLGWERDTAAVVSWNDTDGGLSPRAGRTG